MRRVDWDPGVDSALLLAELSAAACRPGLLVLRFAASVPAPPLPWPVIDAWTRSRAVTAAEVAVDLELPAAEVALCCDLVYLRAGVTLSLPGPAEAPTAGVVWALGRAGRAALREGLLVGGGLSSRRAVELGLATAEIAAGSKPPLPEPHSVAALTAARDLLRSSGADRGGALELATFRLLFATGAPGEGAAAFLEGREPDFRER